MGLVPCFVLDDDRVVERMSGCGSRKLILDEGP